MLKFYSGYRLEHFYNLSYWQGGLTWGQVSALYEQMCTIMNEEVEWKNHEFEFHAAIHGAKMKSKPRKSDGKLEQPKNQELPIFQSPEAYDNMTEEERNELTQKMMQKHKEWSNQTKAVG